MGLPIKVVDGSGEGASACVTTIGQLVTAPYAYDETQFREIAVDNEVQNFYAPKRDKQFVITAIRAKADKQVGTATDAVVIIYEADDAATAVVDKTLHQEALISGESVTLTPINILVNVGKFVNAKSTLSDIHMTITGYYIPELV